MSKFSYTAEFSSQNFLYLKDTKSSQTYTLSFYVIQLLDLLECSMMAHLKAVFISYWKDTAGSP